jgi:putative FmdB family regulatory protein
MPTYEYACQSCGRHVEVFQKFSEDSLTTCEVCGGPLRKVFHPAGILFKGSGFYATDSRRSGASKSGDKRDSESKSSDSKSDSGSSSSSSSDSSSSSGSSTEKSSGTSKEKSA